MLLPGIVVLAVLAFAWPAARIAPRDLPVGIVGTTPASQQVVQALGKAEPGGFDFHLYATEAAARAAIQDRGVYGAFVVTSSDITVLEASAASPTVAQLLSSVGQQLAAEASQHAAAGSANAAVAVKSVDVVPTSAGDPRGMVLSSSLLPLTICSIIIASVIGLVVGFRPAWRQVMALTTVSAVAGLGAFLIAQSVLGALPHQHIATWASLALTILAISSTSAGFIALIGPAGFGLGAVLMVFVGNPFSGVTSAPQLLPDWVDHLGQWLPPGAGANLLRSTAYFDGNGAAGHLVVLILWTVFGLGAVTIGHHSSDRFAAHPSRTAAHHPAHEAADHDALEPSFTGRVG
ncbi:MAG: ABC transporter permease [Actinomycetota bacterium]|nr:ABC transporter permease [Actinomycetota bacterium]MDQ2957265.1 ABC transporter permease [Actinomycetota bacterium]